MTFIVTTVVKERLLNKRPAARAILVVSLIVIAPLSPARAQSIDYGNLEQLFGEPVTASATGSPQRAADVPANMEIITAEDIRRSGADNIPDILQFVAGVDVRRYGFGQAEVSVRGYNQQFSPRLLVLINGRQVYLDDYGHTAWQTLPVQINEIRQIEIVRGPNSALYGFNAVGGVINIVTFDPLLDSKNSLEARGGTQGFVNGSAVITLKDGDKAGLRLSLGGYNAHEFPTSGLPAERGPFNQSPYQFSFSADGRVKLASNVELTAEATLSDARELDALPLPSYNDDSYLTTSLKLGLAADLNFGLVGLSVYSNSLKFEYRGPGADVTDNNTVDVVQASDLFKLGPDHTIRLGLEYRNNSASGTIQDGKIGYGAYAASAMWSWQIVPTLALTNAIRFDELSLNYTGTLVPGIRYSLSDYNSSQLDQLSYNSGIVYKPTGQDTFRLLLARGIQAPSLDDFGLQTTNNIGGTQISFVGNPNLTAASVTNYELDYDRTITPLNATLRMSIYHEITDNLLTSALNAPLSPGAGGLVSYSQNIGSSNADGGKIELKGVSEAGLRWNFSYTYISIEDRFPLGTLTGFSEVLDYKHGAPADVIDMGAGYSWGKFELDGQARWQSKFTDYGSTATNGVEPIQISNYFTMNARIGYRITDNITVGLVGEELTQSQILEAAGTPVQRRIIASITAGL
jgi:outer membrane receptor for ferrienterochelin and colicins